MDRLTGRHPSGLVYVPQGMLPEALNRLAAYEDTGMTPEEIDVLKKQVAGIAPITFGTPVYEIRICSCYVRKNGFYEKAAACSDRCAKAVAVVPIGLSTRKMHCAKIFERTFSYTHIGKVGKTVFLTREEAEAAVKKEDI